MSYDQKKKEKKDYIQSKKRFQFRRVYTDRLQIAQSDSQLKKLEQS